MKLLPARSTVEALSRPTALDRCRWASQQPRSDSDPESCQSSFDRAIQAGEELLASDDAKTLAPGDVAKL